MLSKIANKIQHILIPIVWFLLPLLGGGNCGEWNHALIVQLNKIYKWNRAWVQCIMQETPFRYKPFSFVEKFTQIFCTRCLFYWYILPIRVRIYSVQWIGRECFSRCVWLRPRCANDWNILNTAAREYVFPILNLNNSDGTYWFYLLSSSVR